MAQYKSLPMYEYIRPGIYVLFNQSGDFVTNDSKVIEALDAAAPFIERVNVEPVEPVSEPEPAEVADTPKPRGNRGK